MSQIPELSVSDIVREYGRRLYNLAYRILGHPQDAEDATQDILIKVHEKLGDFRGESTLYTWIYRIAVNHCLKMKGRMEKVAQYAPETLDFWAMDSEPTEFEPNLSPQERKVLLDELTYEIQEKCHFFMTFRLTPEQRIVFILRDVLGLKYQDIAAILDVTENVVKTRLNRARTNLGKHYNEKCSLHDPGNPCRCKGKLGYVITKYPMMLHEVRKKAENPDYYRMVGQLLKNRYGSLEEAYSNIPDLPFPEDLMRKYG
ncbi:RNA polymerase sigma factor [Spirochaeta lutea]|uniref:RNA polymerase subunit sigma-24 n=1 Tax=Spirochaeta lutea TaxID=1480694 RepID=A0A098R3V4_9SPIO|nr:RNA polymerase sigma factor [Spirochaeta lutea]KGE73397.1 hypothetical protein DC28_03760 [Spirochaeta lutea]